MAFRKVPHPKEVKQKRKRFRQLMSGILSVVTAGISVVTYLELPKGFQRVAVALLFVSLGVLILVVFVRFRLDKNWERLYEYIGKRF